jgi:hypothetical protein
MTDIQIGGGGFFRVLGIIYLVRLLKERRRRRHAAQADAEQRED